MRFYAEARALYYNAHQLGKKNKHRSEKQGADPHLVEIISVLDDKKMAGTVDVGVLEIPTEQIVGVADVVDRERYTYDFLPLTPPETEFANQWCELYQHYLSDEGIRNPITCYEYLGQFYVLDGKKRVSVVKCHGGSTICACVTRILPVKTEDPVIQRYYEFLDAFEKTRLYQIAFTHPGSFPKLQKALGYEEDHVWTDSDRYSFMFGWYGINRAFQKAFDGRMKITTADALLVLLEEYTYSQIRNTQIWILEGFFQAAWQKLCAIENDDSFAVTAETRKVS